MPTRRLLIPGFCLFLGLAGCASLPHLPPPPSEEEIVSSSKDGMPPQEIIRRMKDAHAVYLLSASTLVKLHDQGVSDDVINYMQQTQTDHARAEAFQDAYLYSPWWAHRAWWGYGPYDFPYPYYGFPGPIRRFRHL